MTRYTPRTMAAVRSRTPEITQTDPMSSMRAAVARSNGIAGKCRVAMYATLLFHAVSLPMPLVTKIGTTSTRAANSPKWSDRDDVIRFAAPTRGRRRRSRGARTRDSQQVCEFRSECPSTGCACAWIVARTVPPLHARTRLENRHRTTLWRSRVGSIVRDREHLTCLKSSDVCHLGRIAADAILACRGATTHRHPRIRRHLGARSGRSCRDVYGCDCALPQF